MGSATLLPNTTVRTVSTPNIVGAATAHEALKTAIRSDGYVGFDTTEGVVELIEIGFEDAVIPAGAKVIYASIYGEVSASGGTLKVSMEDNGVAHGAKDNWFSAAGTLAYADHNIWQVYRNKARDGNDWTQAKLATITAVFEVNEDADVVRLWHSELLVYWYVKPVVDVTGPATPVTDTTTPTITWDYTQAENQDQDKHQAKVFSAAQYGAVGFNPETSLAVYDSGEITSSIKTHEIAIDLDNGATYRAYVKAKGASTNYSDWDFHEFTINVTAPPAPALVVSPQVGNATGPRVKLEVTRTADATPTTYMQIQYSDDDGATWSYVRGADNIVNDPDGTTQAVYDYELRSNKQRLYRARAVRTV